MREGIGVMWLSYLMSIKGYEIIQPFTVSSSGTIWQATTKTGEACLIRFVARDEADSLADRLEILSRLESPFVARWIDVVPDGARVGLVTSLVEGVPLNQWIQLPGANTKNRVRTLLRSVASGLKDLHEVGLAHGDVSSANVVVGTAGAVLVDHLLGTGFTPGFAAPEKLEGQQGTDPLAADVWAWGALARELGFSGAVVERALDANPATRLSIEQILESPDLKGYDGGAVLAVESDASMLDAGDLLRQETSMAQTVLNERPGGRHARARRKGRARITVASTLVIVGMATLGFWWLRPVAPVPVATSVEEAETSVVHCPSSGEAQSVVSDLTTKRNRAIVTSDRALLETVVDTDSKVFEKDAELIESIEQSGIEIRNLATAVTDVKVVECSPLEVLATFTQNEHERCQEDICEVVEAQPASRLKLTFTGPPWRVSDVTSMDPEQL